MLKNVFSTVKGCMIFSNTDTQHCDCVAGLYPQKHIRPLTLYNWNLHLTSYYLYFSLVYFRHKNGFISEMGNGNEKWKMGYPRATLDTVQKR